MPVKWPRRAPSAPRRARHGWSGHLTQLSAARTSGSVKAGSSSDTSSFTVSFAAVQSTIPRTARVIKRPSACWPTVATKARALVGQLAKRFKCRRRRHGRLARRQVRPPDGRARLRRGGVLPHPRFLRPLVAAHYARSQPWRSNPSCRTRCDAHGLRALPVGFGPLPTAACSLAAPAGPTNTRCGARAEGLYPLRGSAGCEAE